MIVQLTNLVCICRRDGVLHLTVVTVEYLLISRRFIDRNCFLLLLKFFEKAPFAAWCLPGRRSNDQVARTHAFLRQSQELIALLSRGGCFVPGLSLAACRHGVVCCGGFVHEGAAEDVQVHVFCCT